MLALWGAGAALGSALLPRVRHRPLIPLSATSFVLMAVAYMGMGLAPSVEIVCAFSFLGGIGNGVEGFATMTAIQEQAGAEMQARVAGLNESLISAACGLGFVAGGVVAAVASCEPSMSARVGHPAGDAHDAPRDAPQPIWS